MLHQRFSGGLSVGNDEIRRPKRKTLQLAITVDMPPRNPYHFRIKSHGITEITDPRNPTAPPDQKSGEQHTQWRVGRESHRVPAAMGFEYTPAPAGHLQ